MWLVYMQWPSGQVKYCLCGFSPFSCSPSLFISICLYLACIFVFGTASLSIFTQRCLSILRPPRNAGLDRGVRQMIGSCSGWCHILSVSIMRVWIRALWVLSEVNNVNNVHFLSTLWISFLVSFKKNRDKALNKQGGGHREIRTTDMIFQM